MSARCRLGARLKRKGWIVCHGTVRGQQAGKVVAERTVSHWMWWCCVSLTALVSQLRYPSRFRQKLTLGGGCDKGGGMEKVHIPATIACYMRQVNAKSASSC